MAHKKTGNAVGRPLIFKSEAELNDKIKQYFERCEIKDKPFTMSGLALWLDIDRHTLINYGKKDEFFSTVKRARAIVEASTEEAYQKGDVNVTAAIFSLKNNFGWVDRQEIKQEVKNIDNFFEEDTEEEQEDI